jgi:hypothetical protein
LKNSAVQRYGPVGRVFDGPSETTHGGVGRHPLPRNDCVGSDRNSLTGLRASWLPNDTQVSSKSKSRQRAAIALGRRDPPSQKSPEQHRRDFRRGRYTMGPIIRADAPRATHANGQTPRAPRNSVRQGISNARRWVRRVRNPLSHRHRTSCPAPAPPRAFGRNRWRNAPA